MKTITMTKHIKEVLNKTVSQQQTCSWAQYAKAYCYNIRQNK